MHPAITQHYTEVENTQIHYLLAGQGETILLIHGWPTSSYLWRNLMPELAKEYQVIAIDLPGFGKSDMKLEASYSFRYYGRIISGFLENLNIQQLTLGVHDLGGPIGLLWMVQHMEKVDRLILFNTLVYPTFSRAVKIFGLATRLPGIRNLLTSPGGIRWAMNFGVNQKEKLTEEIIRNYQAPFRDRISRKVLLKSVHRLSLKGFAEINQKLPRFKGPVQILYGEKDKILPKVADTMQRVKKDLPQSTIITLPNCGHFLQEEAPEKLSQAIMIFMKQES